MIVQFKTQYDEHDRVLTNPGCRDHILYSGYYDEHGRLCLEECGKEDLYDMIQSHADSCDLHTIIRRYSEGDYDALSSVQGFYGDVLDFPKTYAEALNNMNEMERKFMALPVEVRQKFGNSFTEFLSQSQDDGFLEKLGIKVEENVVLPTDSSIDSEVK